MAQGNFCEYQNAMEIGLMQQLVSFAERSCQEQIDGECKGPGFYIEQLPPGMPGTTMDRSVMAGMGLNGSPDPIGSLGISMSAQAAAVAAMYQDQQMNYPMKPEKGMPPTPPGSPDDPKDIYGMSVMNQHFQQVSSSHMHQGFMTNMSALQQQQQQQQQQHLAKPVPMKILPEKSMSQASECLGTVSSTLVQDPMMAPTLGGYNATDSASYARALAMIQKTQKRPRSEKKPIPVEQKDPRYFERRMRNNMAAKKSRDSRKAREDQIAIRTSRLEKENAILTIQLATLREEMKTLGTLLIQRRARQQH
ncbi:hypothetical protein CHS0354_017901 [Potamilus streckersoni]|uniref:BZIP domain-containing protein n=1 Tax=Potamilus streckersoni TaxID=2493646 RepID=A0AAE0T3P4_9BIVA|nr:hypothetical protein CHS0354_017901 [Potamilus streckersoni]